MSDTDSQPPLTLGAVDKTVPSVISSDHFYKGLRDGRTGQRPEHWPADVEIISLEGLSFLGLDRKGNLYLDGHRVYTERRLATQERIIAWMVAIAAIASAIATGIQAWSAWVKL